MQNSAARLNISLDAGQSVGPEDLDDLTRQLRAELQELDLESVELETREGVPTGAKSADLVSIGSLVIGVLPAMLPKVIEFLQAWSMRGYDRTVKIKANLGDRSIEVEYSPRLASEAHVSALVQTITGALGHGLPSLEPSGHDTH